MAHVSINLPPTHEISKDTFVHYYGRMDRSFTYGETSHDVLFFYLVDEVTLRSCRYYVMRSTAEDALDIGSELHGRYKQYFVMKVI